MKQIQHRDNFIIEIEKQLEGTKSQVNALKFETKKGYMDLEELQKHISELQEDRKLLSNNINQLQTTHNAIVSELRNQIDNKEVTIKNLEEKLSISFVDRILFKFGQVSITPKGRKILGKVGEILKNVRGRQIRVVGHTDKIPITHEYRDRFPSNWELSAARAGAVVRFFQYKIGLDPTNLEVVGRSLYEPIASNEIKAGRAQNRRVNIIIGSKIR